MKKVEHRKHMVYRARNARLMTPLLSRFYELARNAKLTLPLGRAAYQVNRHMNGDTRGEFCHDSYLRDVVAAMRRTLPETARRWQAHWLRGGSLKALRYSHEEWLRLRREREAELRAMMYQTSNPPRV